MSYSPARLDGKMDIDMPDDPVTPSWFPGTSGDEKAEALIARYRNRAGTDQARSSEDEAMTTYRRRIDDKINLGKRKFDPDFDEERNVADRRQARAAISMDDEEAIAETPRLSRRRSRRVKPLWPRFLALGVCAIVLGASFGYGLAQKDQILSFVSNTSDAAKAKFASLSQPLPAAAPSSGNSTMAPQAADAPQPAVQSAVMTEPAQSSNTPPAVPLQVSDNQTKATVLPDPVSPGDNFVTKADALMAQGDVASARQLYLQADGLGNAKGAFGVARSYDPKVFVQLNIQGLQPDASKAAEWYKKAADQGVKAQ